MLLVLIIGISFIGAAPSNVKIAICSLEDNDVSDYIENAVKGNSLFLVDIFQRDSFDGCRKAINDRIFYQSYRAGVIVPKKGDFQTVRLELIVDNSKLVGEYIKSYFRILTDDLSQKITKGYVDLIFSNIDTVKQSLDEVDNRLNQERGELAKVKLSLESVRSNLMQINTNIRSASMDTETAGKGIDISISGIDNVNTGLENSNIRITNALSLMSAANMSEYDRSIIANELVNAQTNLRNQQTSLINIKTNLQNSRSMLNSNRDRLDGINLDTPINSVNSAITSIDTSIENVDFALDKFRTLKLLAQNASIEKPETVQFVDAQVSDFFLKSKFIDFLFPSTVLMVIMILSVFLASITFIRQRTSGLLHRISIVPRGIRLVITERLLIIIFLSLITLPIIILSGVFILQTTLSAVNILILVIIALITALLFASFGLIIASISRYESTAILLSIFIALPMIFLSGILVPFEKLPADIGIIANALPLNISIRLFESLTFYAVDIGTLAGYLEQLTGYFVFSILLAWILIKRDLKN